MNRWMQWAIGAVLIMGATEAVAAAGCEVLFERPLPIDALKSRSYRDQFEALSTLICSSSSSSWNASANVPIPQLKTVVGGSAGADQQSRFCSSRNHVMALTTDDQVEIQKVSDAWVELLGKCISSEERGFSAWVVQSVDHATALLTFRYRPVAPALPRVEFRLDIPPGLSCTREEIAVRPNTKITVGDGAPEVLRCVPGKDYQGGEVAVKDSTVFIAGNGRLVVPAVTTTPRCDKKATQREGTTSQGVYGYYKREATPCDALAIVTVHARATSATCRDGGRYLSSEASWNVVGSKEKTPFCGRRIGEFSGTQDADQKCELHIPAGVAIELNAVQGNKCASSVETYFEIVYE